MEIPVIVNGETRTVAARQTLLELLLSDFEIPGGFNGPPTLLELDTVGFTEMSFGIALHMHGAELNIGIGEQALGNRQKPGKIVLNEDHDAAQSTFQQAA